MKDSLLEANFDIVTINEILQDTYFFYMLLELKRKLKNVESKSYLTMFIKNLAVTFVYELSVCLEKCRILNKDAFFKKSMKKRVRDERQWLHQDITNSKKMTNKIIQMGLNFDEFVYDINIVVKADKLLGINFEDFDEDLDLDFWNSVFYLNEQTLETIFKVFDEMFKVDISKKIYEITDEYITKRILKKVNTIIDGTRYSYSVAKLFKNSDGLEKVDKVMVLYRYRLISSVMLVDKLFKNNELKISIDPLFNLDFNNYLRKYRAQIICIIGNDLMKIKTNFSESILCEINSHIDEKFYPLNRKLRDNIHYSQISNFSQDDLVYLDKNQKLYLNIIYKNFIDNMNVDIENEDILMTNFLKCCSDNGLTSEDIKEGYEKLYLEYYYTGNIKK